MKIFTTKIITQAEFEYISLAFRTNLKKKTKQIKRKRWWTRKQKDTE